jgi:GcrA cell cycle regulator
MNQYGESPWTDERVEILRKLWADGLSGSEVARRLGGFDHCEDGGRRAVCGKVHRLGLPHRLTHVRVASGPRKQRAARVPKTPRPPRNMHIARVKPIPAPVAKPNKFDASPASQAAMALLGKAYKREGLSL